MNKILMYIVLSIILLASCTTGEISSPLLTVSTIPEKSYPGKTIIINVEFKEDQRFVNVEYPKNEMMPMLMIDKKHWKLEIISSKRIGKIDIGIFAKPCEGQIIRNTFSYEILETPSFETNVSLNISGSYEVFVRCSKHFKRVYLVVDDATQLDLINIYGNDYKLILDKLNFERSQYKVIMIDDFGNQFSELLSFFSNDNIVIYQMRYHSVKNNTIFYNLFQTKTDSSLEKVFKNISINTNIDAYINNILQTYVSSNTFDVQLVSISPSISYALLKVVNSININSKFIDLSGEIIESIKATYSVLYNLKTHEYDFIGKPNYYKKYKNPRSWWVFSEEGPLYHFIRWENDNLILLDQRKNPKINYDNSNIQDLYYSTLATSKIVSFSINKKVITETNHKSITDWLTFSDQNTGIQGWGLPHQKMGIVIFELPQGNTYGINNTVYLSIFGNNNKYDLRNLIPEKIDNKPLEYLAIKYTGFEDKKPFAIIMSTYQIEADETTYVYLVKTYKLFPLTGELVEICSYKNDDTNKKESIEAKEIKSDCIKDYCEYYTTLNGKFVSKNNSSRYINRVGQIVNIYSEGK